MEDLKFQCFDCSEYSEFKITSQNRGEVLRLHSGGKLSKVLFICTNCGTANEIEISLQQATILLERLESDNPAVQNAIDQAKRGDYSEALKIARNRFGF